MTLLTRLCLAPILLLASCGGDGSSATPVGPCETPPPVTDTKGLPGDLDLERFGTIVQLSADDGFVGARAITDQRIIELYPPLARAVLDAGYDIFSSENEGFEAEIFFRRRNVQAVYRLREGPCAGQVTIILSYAMKKAGR
jgi:hypothetical protein